MDFMPIFFERNQKTQQQQHKTKEMLRGLCANAALKNNDWPCLAIKPPTILSGFEFVDLKIMTAIIFIKIKEDIID